MSGQLRFAEVNEFTRNGGTVLDWNEVQNQEYIRRREELGGPFKRHLLRERHREWWEQYNRYLLTPGWQTLRSKILKRDNYTCQQCHSRTAKQVHHLSYARVGHELDSDLASVCEECHKELHADDEDCV